MVLSAAAWAAVRWWPVAEPSRAAADRPVQAPASVDDGTVTVPSRPARRAGAPPREAPTSVRLATGSVVDVRAVSARTDGVLDVPDDLASAGWWRGGSALGDPFGSTLLAAHVDSRTQGLGPFASLLDARRGARFEVSSPGLRQVFATTSVRRVERRSALRDRSIYDATGERRLVLVTCAPPYLPERGGYQRLVVVTATPTSDPQRRAG